MPLCSSAALCVRAVTNNDLAKFFRSTNRSTSCKSPQKSPVTQSYLHVLRLYIQAVSVKANYTLEILMLSYRNPTSMALSQENFRHGCCERDVATPCNPCDNAFRVCAREVITRHREGACDFELESELIKDNNDELMFTYGDVGGLSNPIRVSGDMWPVSYLNIEFCNATTTLIANSPSMILNSLLLLMVCLLCLLIKVYPLLCREH